MVSTRSIVRGVRTILAITTLVATTALAAAASGQAPDENTEHAEHVIPSTSCRGLWIVTIQYRDGPDGGLRMVLDTGAGSSSVDPESIERVFGKRVRAGKRVTLKDGTAGPLELHRLKVRVHDMDHLSRALGYPMDGILGFPTFRGLLLTLDYGAMEIRVGKGNLPRPDGKTVFADPGKVRPYVMLEVGNERLPVLVDSGSAGGFRFDPDDGLRWTHEPRPVSMTTGYDEVRLHRAGRLADDVRVGSLVAGSPVVHLYDGTRLLGFEVLRRFVWTFDQKHKRVRLVADSPAPIVTEPERGIGVAFKPVGAGFEVVRIFDGTPAATADLSPGDLVVAVNGVPVDERKCESGLAPDEDRVTLTVRRAGAERLVDVEVAVLVP